MIYHEAVIFELTEWIYPSSQKKSIKPLNIKHYLADMLPLINMIMMVSQSTYAILKIVKLYTRWMYTSLRYRHFDAVIYSRYHTYTLGEHKYMRLLLLTCGFDKWCATLFVMHCTWQSNILFRHSHLPWYLYYVCQCSYR